MACGREVERTHGLTSHERGSSHTTRRVGKTRAASVSSSVFTMPYHHEQRIRRPPATRAHAALRTPMNPSSHLWGLEAATAFRLSFIPLNVPCVPARSMRVHTHNTRHITHGLTELRPCRKRLRELQAEPARACHAEESRAGSCRNSGAAHVGLPGPTGARRRLKCPNPVGPPA